MWILFLIILVVLIVVALASVFSSRRRSEYLSMIREDLDGVCEELRLKPNYELYESNSISFTWEKKTIYIVLWDQEREEYYDYNTIMLAALHELSHIICKDKDHGPRFDQIESKLQEAASRIGIVDLDQGFDPRYPARE